MNAPKIFESEYRFCLILWEHEPIKSRELAALCQEQLGWKTTTTYTVIKRLSDRGVLKNEKSVVTSLVTREQVQADEIEELVEKKFDSSLPAFVAAFTRSVRLSKSEIDELQSLIDRCREEDAHD
ncbi:MAG: BlaI/MecI/CopY family transcriptional regulator [Lachnospiraceae bacterium]|nr:BlaI/MecI/CopY family transcriptional regulator [Lachnospiraceae bacterium]